MKRLMLLLIFFRLAASHVQGQMITENFETYNLKDAIFLLSEVRFGNFIYEFRYNGAVVDSSSLATCFDDDGSIFIGQQKKVTAFHIKSYNGDEFSINSLQLSSNHSRANPGEEVVVSGWRDGKEVTEPVTIQISLFEPPGRNYDMSRFKGFDRINEIKITGENLQFTLESFTYEAGNTAEVRKKGSNRK